MEIKIVHLQGSNFVWCNISCLSQEHLKYITWENKHLDILGASTKKIPGKLFTKVNFWTQIVENLKKKITLTFLKIKESPLGPPKIWSICIDQIRLYFDRQIFPNRPSKFDENPSSSFHVVQLTENKIYRQKFNLHRLSISIYILIVQINEVLHLKFRNI